MSHRIVFLESATIGPEVELRRPAIAHSWTEYDRTTADQVVERAAGADILVVNKVPLRAETLDRLPALRFVAVAATGTDNVDLAACRERGIGVANVRAYAVHTVPEHTFALILSLRRSLAAYRDTVAAGGWQAARQFTVLDHPIRDLHGSTLGIVGGGAIGGAVAAIGRAFGMEVLFAGRKGGETGPSHTPFEEVLERCDVLTLHCPLTPQTRNLLGEAEFARMTRRPLVVNTARGGLIEEAALVAAIESGAIAGAGIDVVSVEPPAEDHPYMRLARAYPNFLLTPHAGWASREARQAVADQVTANIEAFAAGTPRNLVT